MGWRTAKQVDQRRNKREEEATRLAQTAGPPTWTKRRRRTFGGRGGQGNGLGGPDLGSRGQIGGPKLNGNGG